MSFFQKDISHACDDNGQIHRYVKHTRVNDRVIFAALCKYHCCQNSYDEITSKFKNTSIREITHDEFIIELILSQ
jgi:hypothetical protein